MSGAHTPTRHRFPSGRKKAVAALATTVVVAGGAIGYFALFPKKAPAFVRSAMATVGIVEDTPPPAPPPTCPLTGEEVPGAEVPTRPALAIKV